MRSVKSFSLTTLILLFTTWIRQRISCAALCLVSLRRRKARWVPLAGIVLLISGYPQGTLQHSDKYRCEVPTPSSPTGCIDSLNSRISVRDSFPCVDDYPHPISFHPTTIKDIESALPGDGISLIEAPQPNNLGDARLSYPIEIPPGRNGLQPDIAVKYDSGNGNGWMGIGWDVAVSEITIDVRWGVPRYDAAKETETYMFDGEQLTPVAHRGSLQDRSAEKIFRTRVEGQFYRIVRHGDHPANYWWEVTDKSGTRYFYGGTQGGSGPDPEATLAAPITGNIFRWMLREVRDTWGNTIQYGYDHVNDYGIPGGVVNGSQIYPREIRYTGFEGAVGPYKIRFVRDRDLPDYTSLRRSDVIINTRSGFKMVTADLLKHMEIFFQDELIRRYDFDYQKGAFEKTLLGSITQCGPDGTPLSMHEFEYFDEIRDAGGSYIGFESPDNWLTYYDDVSGLVPIEGQASAIGGYPAISGGGHLYVGFNFSSPTKQDSFGGKVGYTRSTSDGLLELMDITGDSLPDKVFKEGGHFCFRRNLSGPAGVHEFGPKLQMPTLPAMFYESSDSMIFGAEGYPPISSVMLDYTHTFTTRDTYFADVNGDGFPDLIDGGTVWFNHPDEQGIPTFTLDSQDTPVPIGSGAVDATDLIDDYTDIFEKRIDKYPLIDPVRRWVAPYNGYIRISGDVQLIEDTSPVRASYRTADGVRVAIQHNGSEVWSARIEADDYEPHTPVGVDAIPVARNDRLYFRVQSIFDGSYDQVAWDPLIEYVGVADGHLDANRRDPYRYSASEDFVLAGRGGKTRMPYNGTIRLTGDLEKLGITTDDITLVVIKNGTPVITRSMAWSETGVIPLQDELDVAKSDKLEFYVRTDSPIDVTLIQWVPEIVYIAAEGFDSVTDPDGNYFIRFNPPYDVDLYPEHDLTVPQQPWVAPTTGTVEVIPWLVLPPPLPFQVPLRKESTSSRTKADALQPDSLADLFDSELVLTVKRPGKLVAKRLIVIHNSMLPPVDDMKFSIDVVEGEELFFDYSTRDGRSINDPGLAARLLTRKVIVDYHNPPLPGPIEVPSDFHRSVLEVEAFPEPYRAWSFIAYNGNRDRANHPINESLLVIDTNYSLDNAMVYLQIPYPAEHCWRASDELCWIAGAAMSSSRLGMDNIQVPRPSDFAGARAVSLLSDADETVVSASIGILSGSITIDATSRGKVDFLDVNGDAFPDVVGKNRVQYTTLTGGLEPVNRSVAGLDPIRSSDNEAKNVGLGFGIGGNPAKNSQTGRGDIAPSGSRNSVSRNSGKSKGGSSAGRRRSSSGASKQGSSGKQGSSMPELGFGGELGEGSSKTARDLVDINGDGLPDRVVRDGSTLKVALNLGYGFAALETWGSGTINESESNRRALSGTLGFNDDIYGLAGGASYTYSENGSQGALVDMNGDGLVDLVSPSSGGFTVALNTGAGFASPIHWSGGCNNDIAADVDATMGGGAYFTIGIGPLCLAGCYIIINPGGDVDFSISRPETSFMDVNGDGCVDHIHSSRDDQLQVALNRVGKTNLLKKVTRPLGATITLDYERDGNTVDYPPSRWNLSRVEVFDGHPGDGVDTLVTACQYTGPIFEPNERSRGRGLPHRCSYLHEQQFL
jgi:hypothetical protein